MAFQTKRKGPPRSMPHRRRHGLHQKRNERFLKTYWPYLPLLMVVVIGLAINGWWSAHSRPSVLAYATEMSLSNLLSDTNSQRSGNGESALHENSELDVAAQAKANDMVARDYWSHNTPDGTPPWTFITSAGYQYSTAGENLAYGFDTSADTITGWMNSAEHRANILNGNFVDVGFGFANSANFQGSGPETIVVAEYAAPAAAASVPVASTPPAKAPTPVATSAPTPAASTSTTATTQAPTPAAVATTTPSAAANNVAAATPKAVAEPAAQKVARIQIITAGSAPWSMFVASTLASAGLLIFFIKHGLGLRRAWVHGETFIIHHRLLDLMLVMTTVAGYILTRTAGVIR